MTRFLFKCLFVAALTGTANAAPWKFAVFCDGRAGNPGENGSTNGVHVASMRPLAADAAREKVSLVIFPGDLVNGGTNFGTLARQLAAWKESMAPLYAAHIPVYVCRGNHELHQDDPPGSGAAAWQSFFPELPRNGPDEQKGLTYKVDFNNACFIGCDQFAGRSKTFDPDKYDSTVNAGMVSPWVIDQVRQSKARWVFVFGHESAFIGHHTDCLANVPAERDALWDALGEKGGVYLSGHDHMYVRHWAPDCANRPVLELLVGCAGAPPYPYDKAGLNLNYDRHVVPTDLFVNAGGDPTANTNGYPMYFGYVLITVDGSKIRGQWRAFTNYDTKHLAGLVAPEEPAFETLDAFSWP
jgi:hypothetical protein